MKTLCFLSLILLIPYALAWGDWGHEAIAHIAYGGLDSSIQSKIKSLIYPKTLEDIAPLPDDYCHSAAGKWSCPCHYVNVPRNALHFDLDVDCAGICCVAKAVNNYTTILQDHQADWATCKYGSGNPPCALEFLTHFSGDIHQPLHVGYGYDRGGNLQNCYWYGELTELHEVWDNKIIEKYASSVDELIQNLQQYISSVGSSQVEQWADNQSTDSWADESFYYVRTTVYKFNSSSPYPAVPQFTPNLSDWYYNQNLPVVKQRLAQAAVRLQKKLSDLFA